jgi:hypothetical protein
MPDYDITARMQAVEAEGQRTYGKTTFENYLTSIRKAVGTVPEASLRQVLDQPDAADRLAALGKEAMLQLMANGDKLAEQQYAEIRQVERDNYRAYKGRS